MTWDPYASLITHIYMYNICNCITLYDLYLFERSCFPVLTFLRFLYPRPELVERCAKEHLAKTGNMLLLRERLVNAWLQTVTLEDIALWAHGKPDSAAEANVEKPSSGKEASHSKPVASKSSTAVPSDAQPSCGSSVVAGDAGGGGGDAAAQPSGSQNASVLAGCATVLKATKDKTNYFTDLDVGPPLPDPTTETIAEIVGQADALVPVAAFVKVVQVLTDHPLEVALFFAGGKLVLERFQLLVCFCLLDALFTSCWLEAP